MKLQKITLIALALLVSVSGLWAQEKQQADKKGKNQMVIIKKSIDADGKEVIERIVKDVDSDGEHHFEYRGEDGEIIELKMDGENEWHSISEDIHFFSDDTENMKVIDIKDIDGMTEELQEHLKRINIEVESLDDDKIFEIKMTDEDGEDHIIKMRGEDMGEHNLHEGHFENNFHFQHNDNKAFLGVVSGKKVEVVNENGVETRTEDDHSDVNGAYIQEVVKGSAAEAAGLQDGDVITNIDGTTISDFSDLSKKLADYEVGDQINISYVRNNATAQTTATLGERKHSDQNFTFEWKDEDGEDLHFGEGNKFFFKEDSEGDDEPHVIILRKEDKENGENIKKRIVIITKSEVDTDEEVEVQVEIITSDEMEDPAEEILEIAPEEIVEIPPAEIEVAPNHQLELQDFDAYPNPTNGQIQVKFSAPARPIKLTITNVDGREVYRDRIQNFDGFYNKQINLKDVAKGTLILSITQDDQVFTKQIVLQ